MYKEAYMLMSLILAWSHLLQKDHLVAVFRVDW